jgi:valyl-tRNA synthetase
LWGQQIPYFYGDGKEDFVVAESIEAALELAKVKTSNFSLLLTLDKMLMH